MDGFKKFLLRGNVVDLAVGVVIGAAFTAVVTTFVTGVINPLIGLFGSKNFDAYDACLKGSCAVAPDGTVDGVLLRYGAVLTALLTFVLTAAVLYVLVVRPVNALMARASRGEEAAAPDTATCPECLSTVPAAAIRCAACTVELTPSA